MAGSAALDGTQEFSTDGISRRPQSPAMHHITSSVVLRPTSIEVDGCLDVVAAYDLHRRVHAALRQGHADPDVEPVREEVTRLVPRLNPTLRFDERRIES
jgi:hypothetical protein